MPQDPEDNTRIPKVREHQYKHPLKPWKDPESLFCDTEFLKKIIGTSFEMRKDDKHHILSWILSDNCEIRDKQLSSNLKDKNGKEIYEGDIVDCSRYSEPPEIYRVVVKDIRSLPQEMFGSNLNSREIVGNIYENPELVRDKSPEG